jgi:hypothetical protein
LLVVEQEELTVRVVVVLVELLLIRLKLYQMELLTRVPLALVVELPLQTVITQILREGLYP